jgi:hypothetical protein
MIAGADSIDDLDVLRHGGMTELFGGIRACTVPKLVTQGGDLVFPWCL